MYHRTECQRVNGGGNTDNCFVAPQLSLISMKGKSPTNHTLQQRRLLSLLMCSISIHLTALASLEADPGDRMLDVRQVDPT
jgi:hypothetical protein